MQQPEDEDTPAFGAELRRRRIEAGKSLKGLADEVYCTKGHLSRVENGQKRPGAELARECDRVLGAKGALLALARPAPPPCPYPGLASFGTEDARWFSGRDRATAELVCLLADPSTAGHPVMLIGPSGVGKSSLLRAGVTPAVTGGALPGRVPGPAAVRYLTPTARPMAQLHVPTDSCTLLIVDQFEELFTLCDDEAERDVFADELCRLAQAGPAVVAAIRADFYGHCLAHPGLREALRTRSLPLGPMDRAELRLAITEPAAAAGLALEPGLVEVLLRDLGEHACEVGALPLLSHTLRATWQHRADGMLTVAGYERTGGVHGAVATTAERAYARLTPQEQKIAPTVLLGLVRVGEGTSDTRRRAERRALAASAGGQAVVKAVVEEFTRARLLTADAEHVEISHEALLHAWPRLREWIDADRVGLLVRQRLTDDATAWQAAGRDDSHLYRGSRLAAAEEWHGCADDQTVEGAFLAAAHRRRQRDTRRRRRLTAALAALAVTAVAAAIFAVDQAGRATRQAAQAVSARLGAEADAVRPNDPALAAHLALAALQAADTPQARNAVIGSSAPPYATRYVSGGPADATAWAGSPDGRILAEATPAGDVRVWDTAATRHDRPLLVHAGTAAIARLAVHPGHVLAATDSGRVRLWDLRGNGPPVRLPDLSSDQGPLTAMEFSADGSRLATGDDHGRLALWDTTDPRHPEPLHRWQATQDHILDLALSRDGRALATVEGDHQATVWDTTDPRHPQSHPLPRQEHRQNFKTVALSPDGRTLALADAAVSAHPILLARLAPDGTPSRPRELSASPSTVADLAFSPDGTALAAGDIDAQVRIWNVKDVRHDKERETSWSLTLRQPGEVLGLAFGPDGTSLAVGTRTDGSRRWQPLPPLAGHVRPLTTLKASQDRRLAITTSADGTARLWDVPAAGAPRPLGTTLTCQDLPLTGAAFSPDRHTLALTTAAPDTSDPHKPTTWAAMCLWDISHPEAPRPLGHGHAHTENHINDAAFSPDGRTLVTGGNGNHALVVWDVSDPGHPRPHTRSPLSTVTSLTFLGRTATLAVGTDKAGAQLWDVQDPHHPRLIRPLPGALSVASLSATDDGRLLAAGSDNQRIHLWDLTRPLAPVALPALSGHKGTVWQVDLDARGQRLLSTNGISPGPARIWDLRERDRIGQAVSVEGTTGVGVLTGDAEEFLLTTSDHALRRWSTDASAVAGLLCRRAGSPLTAEERQLYGIGEISAPCPEDPRQGALAPGLAAAGGASIPG
ncbi:nSTAND1 domain-containing NTPase [Nonomuraea jabiensis]|uniref:WD40 repeat protein/transcriptional regulator with XRE-family HTH domain n=1 Tax=Nonomuraea jabiensis TaxID=882448 RepID=A0A7W9GDI6_9ACTN|nr:helix-turn-helix domain-containing protein [Nonomuraea jabiensis]MBB5781794.1 WD40 repeat protein/transcriptional regulator with XRE-family HTH domain [Nonomuraea jabiensis]